MALAMPNPPYPIMLALSLLSPGCLPALCEVVAPGAQDAVLALGPAGDAHRPPMEDQPVAEVVGFLWRQDRPELCLHLARVLVPSVRPSMPEMRMQ